MYDDNIGQSPKGMFLPDMKTLVLIYTKKSIYNR